MGDITLSDLKNTTYHQYEFKSEKKNTFLRCLKSNTLTLLTILGVIGGVGLGFILRASRNEPWPARHILYVNFAGDIFLRILKSLILPLIFSSLISAIGSLDLKLSGKIGVRAVGYYLSTTICAVVLGIIVVVIVHPGRGKTDISTQAGLSRNVTTVDTLMDLFRYILHLMYFIQLHVKLLQEYVSTKLNSSLHASVSHRFDAPTIGRREKHLRMGYNT